MVSLEEFQNSLTIGEVAAIAKVKERTVQKWCTEGKLPHYFICRRFYVKREDLDMFIKETYREFGNID